jgi:hypothetical protein
MEKVIRTSEYQVGTDSYRVFPEPLVSWYPASWSPNILVSFSLSSPILHWTLCAMRFHNADTPEKLNPSTLIAGTTVPVTKRLE